jgi:crotonobetainyl-CoA:carnitine CoA-transferase CaiB-like acyl-CoA transferase
MSQVSVMDQEPGPLAGVKVLDLTHGVAGPYCVMQLGDLGADVWKIEMPGRGDATRYMNVSDRFGSDIPASGGDYFLAINRNKRSVAINLKTGAGLALVCRLAEKADVVVSSFRPGVMDRLGLGYTRLAEANQRLIYASLSAYGRRGPLAGQPGMDVAVQARSGVMSITGYEGDKPVKPGASIADFGGGVHLTVAVLAAMYSRERTGVGGQVHVSLLDSMISMLSNYSVAVRDGGATIKPMGSGHPQLVPFQAFPTSDGYVVIATGTNRLFVTLCGLLGLPALSSDPRFAVNSDRVVNREVLVELLSEQTRTQTTDHWLDLFERNSVPAARVSTMAQAFEDEQVVANDMIRAVTHPMYGELHVVGSPFKFGDSEMMIRHVPPQLGQHTAEVLAEVLGLSDAELEQLRQEEVVR